MKRLSYLIEDVFGGDVNSLDGKLSNCGINELLASEGKARVNIIALGDVGTNLLMGLKLLGGDVISEIGIFDLNENQIQRLEMEFNQMNYPPVPDSEKDKHLTAHCIREMPKIKIVSTDEELLDCDVLIFCATRRVPEIGVTGDVRMMQLEANLELVKSIGDKIKNAPKPGFKGLVAVVSDPVDQLCKGMLDSSGLEPGQVRGFGLGVMAARARYYAEKDSRFESYLVEGRGFGPHGKDLVIANSLENYDDELSKELTGLTVEANLRVRDLGFKPFLAPAISSAALSIILTLRGEYCYGSVFFGREETEPQGKKEYRGAYVGVLSRLTETGVEYEDRDLPEELYGRILNAYKNLLM